MPINVTCPSCLKRFSVSDKFAGKSGPCPSCQKTIKIPELSEQVVIHAPESAGPTDSTGKPVLKPIRRKDVKIGTPIIVGASIAAFAVVAVAFGLGLSGDQPPSLVLALGVVALAPPLVFVGYWFLHDDELEGFNGRQLLARCGICAFAFACLWALYGFVPRFVVDEYDSMADYSGLVLAIAIPVMLALGTFVAITTFDFEFSQGLMHYSLYFIVTFALAWLAGAHLAAPLSDGGSPTQTPATTIPSNSADQPPAEDEPPKPTIPNLLQ